MILLRLFLVFLKIGCFAFGGAYAAIPLIRDTVIGEGWIGMEMLTDMIAVSESTPGPIMVNLATYVGAVKGGIPGAALATFAVILPAFLIILAVMTVLDKAMQRPMVQSVMSGLKACVTGIILATGAVMLLDCVLGRRTGGFDPKALLIAAVLAGTSAGYKKIRGRRVSPILLILLSGVMGAFLYR